MKKTIKQTIIILTFALGFGIITAGCTANQDFDQEGSTQQAGISLHQVTVGETSLNSAISPCKKTSRVANEDKSTSNNNNWKPNHVVTGFTSGDKIVIDYTFGTDIYYADATLGEEGKWKLSKNIIYGVSDILFATRPNQGTTTGESWDSFSVEYAKASPIIADGTLSKQEGISQYIEVDGIRSYYDLLCYDKTKSMGTCTISKDGPTTGAITSLQLLHFHSLLRLSDADLKINDGNTELKSLIVTFYNGIKCSFDKVTVASQEGKTTTYWQSIVPMGFTVQSLTAITGNADNDDNNITYHGIDASKVNDGKSLWYNIRYDLTLKISSAAQQVTSQTPELPGWGTEGETELKADPKLNTKDIEFKTVTNDPIFGHGEVEYYEIKTAKGLMMFAYMTNYMLAKLPDALGGGTISDKKYTYDNGDFVFLGESTYFYARLSADIDLSSVCSSSLGKSWIPISSDFRQYNDIFDGNGKTVSNLYIETESDNQGLFGSIYDRAVIRNLTLWSVKVKGNNSVGGLVGNNYGATIIRCSSWGTVSGTSQDAYVGGLVGYNNNKGIITACGGGGSISGSGSNGGLVGHNIGVITACTGGGYISGSGYNGGLVGHNSGTITACYTTSNVLGEGTNGGLAGYMDSGTITGCCYYYDYLSTNEVNVRVVGYPYGGSINYCVTTTTDTTLSGTNKSNVKDCDIIRDEYLATDAVQTLWGKSINPTTFAIENPATTTGLTLNGTGEKAIWGGVNNIMLWWQKN